MPIELSATPAPAREPTWCFSFRYPHVGSARLPLVWFQIGIAAIVELSRWKQAGPMALTANVRQFWAGCHLTTATTPVPGSVSRKVSTWNICGTTGPTREMDHRLGKSRSLEGPTDSETLNPEINASLQTKELEPCVIG